MPELPEVQIVVSELNRKLKNKTIKQVVVTKPKMVSVGPHVVSNIRQVESYKVKKFIKLLIGQRFLSVKRRAKLLIFDLSQPSLSSLRSHFGGVGKLRRASRPLSMLVHLKMTGQFIYEDKKLRQRMGSKYRIINKLTAPLVQLPSKYTHVIFYFTDKSVLYFNDLRQFGYLKLVRDDELNQVPELNAYGPEPLSKAFTLLLFYAAAQKGNKRTIKQMLMDPKVVAGIGNIYSDEILFHAKILPNRRVDTLDKKEIGAIYKQIRPVLKTAIKYKGSSVGDFVRTDGAWGSMGKHHFVYGRKGQPCKHCGTIIKSIKLGGRTASFCPNCQA